MYMVKVVNSAMQLLNLTWGAGASVAAGILLEKLKIESKPIQACLQSYIASSSAYCVNLSDCKPNCILTHIELWHASIVTSCCKPRTVSSYNMFNPAILATHFSAVQLVGMWYVTLWCIADAIGCSSNGGAERWQTANEVPCQGS